MTLPRVQIRHPHVVVDENINGGSPTIVGSKVPVRRLWAWHRGGTEIATLIRRYPNIGAAKILDALAFAYDNIDLIQADLEREQKLFEAKQLAEQSAPTRKQLSLPFIEDDKTH